MTLSRAVSYYVKIKSKLAPDYVSTSYISAKKFPEETKALIDNHRTDPNSERLQFFSPANVP